MKQSYNCVSQEGLKAIACAAMLLDHIGAVFAPGYYSYYILRILGRVAFPIYCFLLVEGACYTRNAGKYALRLGIGALLSELPFDLAFYGGVTWEHQSVMVTLLLGLGALEMGKRLSGWEKLLAVVPFAWAAERLGTDYGAWGVILIGAFALVRGHSHAPGKMAILLGAVSLAMGSVGVPFLGNLPIEVFALGAMVPIALYSGEKSTAARKVKLLFYGFYPAHLALLWGIHQIL